MFARFSENQRLGLSIIGAILAVFGFAMLMSAVPDIVARPFAAPTPSGIAAGKYQEEIAEVTLVNQDGAPASLGNFRGKPVLLAFGFTSCPDVCPLTLSDFKKVKTRLGPAGEQVQFAMIFVDPARDTPGRLKQYLTQFDPSFAGLTGDTASLDRIVAEFDAAYEIQPKPRDSDNYNVAHTSFIYLVDAAGRWKLKYPYQTSPDVIATDLRVLLE
jgi:protein SCO1